MKLPWKDYLLMHWPYLVAIALGTVTLIYTHGFRAGQESYRRASEVAYNEAMKNAPLT